MKRRVAVVLSIIIVAILILSMLAPILFAQTVNRGLPFFDRLIGVELVMVVGAGALLLLVIARIILSFTRKSKKMR